MADTSQSTLDNLAGKDPPIAKVPRQWAGLKLAHQAMALDDAQKVLDGERRLLEANRKKHMGDALEPPAGDDMIHVGDQVTNNYPAPQTPAPAPAKAAAGISKLAALGLALGTGGIGAAVPLAISALHSPPAIVQPATPAPPKGVQKIRVVRQLQPDGTWKVIDRIPFTENGK